MSWGMAGDDGQGKGEGWGVHDSLKKQKVCQMGREGRLSPTLATDHFPIWPPFSHSPVIFTSQLPTSSPYFIPTKIIFIHLLQAK